MFAEFHQCSSLIKSVRDLPFCLIRPPDATHRFAASCGQFAASQLIIDQSEPLIVITQTLVDLGSLSKIDPGQRE